jgi:peptidoglycan hydrolase-like protein with peptidoglycan-binding domain
MPEAIRKEIPKHHRGPRPFHNRVNDHVAVSEASSLFGYFSGAGVCSHAYVRKSTAEQLAAGAMATIEQYLPLDNYSAADLDGNDGTFSVETQGGVNNAQAEPWDDGQLRALAYIAWWVHQQTPQVPLRLATSSKVGEESKGLSWHRLGINGNFPALPSILAGREQRGGGMRYSKSAGKICPGNAKIGQMPRVLELALALAGGTTTPVTTTPATTAPVGNGGGVKNWLQQGDTGPAVLALQTGLKTLGYYTGALDSSFGPATLAAVRAFQLANGLVIDGLAGPATQTELARDLAANKPAPAPAASGAVLRRGSSGAEVSALQRVLNKNYPAYSRLTVDGLYGPATEAVVREFQRRAVLEVDGICGPKTRRALGIS